MYQTVPTPCASWCRSVDLGALSECGSGIARDFGESLRDLWGVDTPAVFEQEGTEKTERNGHEEAQTGAKKAGLYQSYSRREAGVQLDTVEITLKVVGSLSLVFMGLRRSKNLKRDCRCLSSLKISVLSVAFCSRGCRWLCRSGLGRGRVSLVTGVDVCRLARQLLGDEGDVRTISGDCGAIMRVRCRAIGDKSPFPGKKRKIGVRNLFQILEIIAANN